MDKNPYRDLPSIDELLRSAKLKEAATLLSTALLTEAARSVLERIRKDISSGKAEGIKAGDIPAMVVLEAEAISRPGIKRVINASGTVLHTNIGRALLSRPAIDALLLGAGGGINLEFDTETGERSERDSHIEALVKRLTGAQAACVVNNNAAAVLIALNTLAEGKEVVISRGELIEIGASFRLPDIIRKSGCILKEIGTTNRTHLGDYTSAITEATALIFKAHTSNYRVVGFTASAGLDELSALAKEKRLPLVEDLGSGSLIDLSKYGLAGEPTVAESLKKGADIVTFSGDKLLGGPQAGIIAGRLDLVSKIKKNPLKRALRADKFTIAALEATLLQYLNLDTLAEGLPTLRHLSRPLAQIEDVSKKAAALLKERLKDGYTITIEDGASVAGAGSLPGQELPTKVIAITHKVKKPQEIFRDFLCSTPAILGRVSKERFLLDLRTVEDPADVVPAGR